MKPWLRKAFDGRHARQPDAIAADANAAVVVYARQDAAAFEDPVGAVVSSAAGALLDQDELRRQASIRAALIISLCTAS